MNNAVDRVEREFTHQDPAVPVTYIDGDATEPVSTGPGDLRFLVHCCNDIGAWGSGFVMAISHKWREPHLAYTNWHYGIDNIYRTTGPFQLGEVQFVQVHADLIVCNLIGQHSVTGAHNRHNKDRIPVRYEAVELGLAKIRLAMHGMQEMGKTCTFHGPKMGADRAGGDWNVIAGSIKWIMCATGISSTVYEWNRKP
jgi:hypothetical protein